MKNSEPRPPSHLSREAKRWWRALEAEYSIDDPGGLLLLQTAMEAFDRMRAASAKIVEEGPTTRDRFGQERVHPAIDIERHSRTALLASLRALNLDLEPLKDFIGRPSGR